MLLLFATLAASSQKVYFIYIQTENSQPFFVKLKEKIYSSTTSGYIILSKLVDTTYSFSIGLANNSAAQQSFSVIVNRKDHGYLLKNFGEKGWGLFDLQTMEVKMSGTVIPKTAENATASGKDVPAFTESLSKASGDPSLKERPMQPIKTEEKAAEPVITEKTQTVVITKTAEPDPSIKTEIKTIAEEPQKKKESLTPESVKEEKSNIKIEPLPEPVQKQPEPVQPVAIEPVQKQPEPAQPVIIEPVQKQQEVTEAPIAEPYKASLVKKKSESSTTEGFGLTYTDTYTSGEIDTIKLLIPNPKTPAAIVKIEEKPVPVENKIACITVAAEADFFLLRKTMAAADGDDAMISEAKKVCKEKCFSTTQYKNLSSLFLTDEGKYKFFDAVYNYTNDAVNFPSLQAELKEEYYINRFKAMLRN
jgi:hypothetical protein